MGHAMPRFGNWLFLTYVTRWSYRSMPISNRGGILCSTLDGKEIAIRCRQDTMCILNSNMQIAALFMQMRFIVNSS